jgi:hypothetical protein
MPLLSLLSLQAAHRGFVDYRQFSKDVEAALAPAGLETQPLGSTQQWVPATDIEIAASNRKVAEHEAMTLQAVLDRFGDLVRARRLEVLPFFRDFDRINNGCVSRSQFSRVLQDLGMMCNDAELAALCHSYQVDVGGRPDVEYRAFSDDIRNISAALNADITGGRL